MKFQTGDIVRFNSKTPIRELSGYLAIITDINFQMLHSYMIRTIAPQRLTEHICGDIDEDWVDKI